MKDWWPGILDAVIPATARPWLDSLPKPARDELVTWLALEVIFGDKTPDDVMDLVLSLGCPEGPAGSSGNWLFLSATLSQQIKQRAEK